MIRAAIIAGACFLALGGPVEARQARSHAAIAQFKKAHPCPANGHPSGPCPGWVIDHVKPLACGGPDRPDNMQWQSVADAKAKDKWERKGCAPAK